MDVKGTILGIELSRGRVIVETAHNLSIVIGIEDRFFDTWMLGDEISWQDTNGESRQEFMNINEGRSRVGRVLLINLPRAHAHLLFS